MSYPLSLDEYPEEQLRAELALRKERRARGRCDYCDRMPSEPSCKFPGRHHARKDEEG